MKIYRNFESMPFIGKAVVTVGTFDGVHVAHRAILEEVIRAAKDVRGKSMVVTFTLPPKMVINSQSQEKVLLGITDKNLLFQKIGIDFVVYIDFTPTFANTNYSDFIKNLTSKIDIQRFVVGYNHSFGKNKAGDASKLLKMKALYGYEVDVVPQKRAYCKPYRLKLKVSSSAIRAAISKGDFIAANVSLGYDYHLSIRIICCAEEYIIAKLLEAMKVHPPEGVYEVKINDIKTILKIDTDEVICIKNNNITLTKGETLPVYFLKKCKQYAPFPATSGSA